MDWNEFIKLYDLNLRQALFSSLFSLAAFLFAMKTFIVVKMKEGLYDTPEYKIIIQQKRQRNPNHSFYGSLRRLSSFLTYSIFSAIIGALAQITIGFIKTPFYVCIALSLAAVSVALLIISIILSSFNLNNWFDKLEEKAKKEKN